MKIISKSYQNHMKILSKSYQNHMMFQILIITNLRKKWTGKMPLMVYSWTPSRGARMWRHFLSACLASSRERLIYSKMKHQLGAWSRHISTRTCESSRRRCRGTRLRKRSRLSSTNNLSSLRSERPLPRQTQSCRKSRKIREAGYALMSTMAGALTVTTGSRPRLRSQSTWISQMGPRQRCWP